ncbi:GGDEF domain-containing protein [Vibrio sp. SCSIO 43136]|uniref:GGDEF domain-containing protein n=1 Tax=Vibrio sp. SCSIO 43136 TaxID=2819101 RepID=UPI0020759A26|nr:GGDEF domain-containing protein [Vibrio sp. SCSIO 43136]USD67023.1 diguanylate cyclase [Vibrio sp. SCSIO 43136]
MRLAGNMRTLGYLVVVFISYNSWADQDVVVGLRWLHQYQFAGYYAAVDQGYYKQEGLNVTLIQGHPGINVMDKVVTGEYDFGVANGDLVLARMKGRPLVALAAIFQHSPSVLLTLASSGIDKPKKLKNKSIMTLNGQPYPEFLAMFSHANVALEDLEMKPSSYQIRDLIDGKIDAFNGYLTNEPYLLDKLNVRYHVLNPAKSGSDFYSDILFTSEALRQYSPEVVKAFRRATLDGWRYALDHPEEVIQSIRFKWGSHKSLDELRYEALAMSGMVRPELVEIGYINAERIASMAQVFVEHGHAVDTSLLDDFVYKEAQQEIDIASHRILFLTLVITSMGGLCAVLLLVSRQLHAEVKKRKAVEEQLRYLASIDPLTELCNRRSFKAASKQEEAKAISNRSAYSILLLDIDFFKAINDQYGHDSGDNVIKEVAKIIQLLTKSGDICARYGGEEFIIMMPDSGFNESVSMAQILRSHINSQTFTSKTGHTFKITASFGIAEWDKALPIDSIISHADQALYLAKASGRDNIKCYTSSKTIEDNCAVEVRA